MLHAIQRCSRSSTMPLRVAGRRNTRQLPVTLQELVMARIDRMSINCEVAQLAAILGREFDFELLASVVVIDERILRAELEKLVSAVILYTKGQPPTRVYIFRHVLLEEALRGSRRRGRAEHHSTRSTFLLPG